ncbi:MAG: energy-coupling factor transporter transmembrane protein EcfT [Acidobacteriota bacterium]|nr:energy-coupling factor transporter transmembrane protein EcfT [Acidobacteriota bacterium]
MRHARIERWSQGRSSLHRRHAAAKIPAALVLLISIATLEHRASAACGLYALLLIAITAAAGLPLKAILLSAAAVLPFAFCFALVTALAGDPDRALLLLTRAWLSSLTALLLIATTPMPSLIAGLEFLHAPRFLLQVMQFLYRYLVVLMEEGGAMRQASAARGGSPGALLFRHSAAAAGVLFARAYARAQAIHRAMLSRGFESHMPVSASSTFRAGDMRFLAMAIVIVVAVRLIP